MPFDVVIVVVGAFSVVFAIVARKGIDAVVRRIQMRCPACNEKKIELDEREHVGGVDPAIPGELFVCTACGAELVRRDGPLIAREAFRAGAREPLPQARVVEPKRPIVPMSKGPEGPQ